MAASAAAAPTRPSMAHRECNNSHSRNRMMSNGSSYGCVETIESVFTVSQRAKRSHRAPFEENRFDSKSFIRVIRAYPQNHIFTRSRRDRYPMDDDDRLDPRERCTMRERTRTRRPKMCARTYRQRPRLGLVIRRLHLADDVPARVLRGGAVEGVRGELQVFRLLSELERVESAVARKRTVEPRRAVTERERDLRRIARVFSSVDGDRHGGRARAHRSRHDIARVSRSHAPRPDRRAGHHRSPPFSPAPSSPVSSPRASRATPSSSPASPSSSPSRSSWSSSSSRVAEWRRSRGCGPEWGVDRGVVTGRSGRASPRPQSRGSRS